MQISDKRVWRCRVCKQDLTPRCPTCKVVIGQSEAEIGMCNTCRRALPENLANCPHCSTEKSLIFSPATGYPKGLRGMLLSSTKSGQVLIGLIQVVGLFLIIQSLGNLNILPSDLETKDSFPIGFIGIVLLFGLAPVQFLLIYTIFRLKRVPVRIGTTSSRINSQLRDR